MKKFLATLLALIMCFGTFGAFAAAKEFTDVSSADWFYNDVKTAVELGLVNGKGEGLYAPNDKLTYAEAVKLAACMHQLSTTGKIDIAAGTPWYMPYADYCKANQIITKEYNYSDNATRAGYMEIFANALPGDGLKAINSVADNSIPDVPSTVDYAAGVYKLYRAGILQGVDADHNCSPLNNITRAEVAAILNRMMNPEKRVQFTLGEIQAERFELVRGPKSATVAVMETAICEVEVTGGVVPYTYQWYLEYNGQWVELRGETTEKLTVSANTAGVIKIKCVIMDGKKTKITTGAATITIEDNNALQIVTQPASITVKIGEDANVSVETKGGSDQVTYQWQWDLNGRGNWMRMTENDVWIGTTTPNLTVKSTTAANLPIRCVITDTVNNVKIETATANVIFN